MTKTATTLRSLRDFAAVGILATLVHYLVLEALLKTGTISSLALANMAGYCSSLIISYTGNRYFVFEGKHGHLSSFGRLVIGYLAVLALHTGLIVGLTGGQIITALQGPLGPFGGTALVNLWQGFLNIMPPPLADFLLAGSDIAMLSTSIAFLAASGTAAILTYFWNRFVVFQPKAIQAVN